MNWPQFEFFFYENKDSIALFSILLTLKITPNNDKF